MQRDGFQDLVRRAQQGDPQAWQQLLVLAQPYVRQRVDRLVGSGWRNRSAHDLIQETLLRAFESFGSFRGGDTDEATAKKFQSWLARIARTVYLNRQRSRKTLRANPPTPLVPLGNGAASDSTSQLGVGEVAGKDPTPSKDLVDQERQHLIQQAVEGLDARDREIVQLRIFEGWSFAQIGERLGCDESTVRYHFHESLQQLAPKLKGLV